MEYALRRDEGRADCSGLLSSICLIIILLVGLRPTWRGEKERDPHTVPQTAFLALRQGTASPAPLFMRGCQSGPLKSRQKRGSKGRLAPLRGAGNAVWGTV